MTEFSYRYNDQDDVVVVEKWGQEIELKAHEVEALANGLVAAGKLDDRPRLAEELVSRVVPVWREVSSKLDALAAEVDRAKSFVPPPARTLLENLDTVVRLLASLKALVG